jgi:hypothetical protein
LSALISLSRYKMQLERLLQLGLGEARRCAKSVPAGRAQGTIPPGRAHASHETMQPCLNLRCVGSIPENKRDDLLSQHLAGTRDLTRPQPERFNLTTSYPASARANRLIRFPLQDLRPLTRTAAPRARLRPSRLVSRRAPIQSPVPAISEPSPGATESASAD